jgi:hypothetical protein
MLNSHDRSGEMLRAHLEAEAKAEAARRHAISAAAEQRARFEAAKKQAEMQRAHAAMANPSVFSWQGAAAALFLLGLIGGIFLIATYLGN